MGVDEDDGAVRHCLGVEVAIVPLVGLRVTLEIRRELRDEYMWRGKLGVETAVGSSELINC